MPTQLSNNPPTLGESAGMLKSVASVSTSKSCRQLDGEQLRQLQDPETE